MGIEPRIPEKRRLACLVDVGMIPWRDSNETGSRTWLRLRHIPGPRFAGVAELWLLQSVRGGRCHMDTAEACKKYGSIVRVGPHQLVTGDPDVLRKMSAVRSPYRRSSYYDGMRLEPNYTHVLSERDENRHNQLRANMGPGFIHLLGSKYLSTNTEFKPVDFAPKAQYFTLDVISEIAFGEAFGNLEADEDLASYIKTTEETIPILICLTVFPWLVRIFFSWPFTYLLPSDKDTVGLGKLMGIAKVVAAERFGEHKKERRDMLGSFVRHGLTQREIQAEILLQLIAGSDTSALAIRATLLYIVTNAQVQATLLQEISNAAISNPIRDTEARKLPYLQAVIKEGLRMYPPATALFLKEVPAGGDTINGFFVPEGTSVWGDDANLFRPERWLEGDAEEIQKKELNLELLLRNFGFTIVDPTMPWRSFNAGLFLQSDMWVRVTRRKARF
ncbi:cytochrome P450 [Stipitochalara longipes BDJ]|nr:cytochrome P450 [Stipitochalara longipes BDJ]